MKACDFMGENWMKPISNFGRQDTSIPVKPTAPDNFNDEVVERVHAALKASPASGPMSSDDFENYLNRLASENGQG